MSAIDTALGRFSSISLAGANDVAELQTRVDRKYIVDEATLCDLLGALDPAMRVLEIDGARSCDYHSTYFDTEDFALYRAAIQGRRRRYKVRCRAYGAAGPCFLEVKAKGSRGVNVKTRIGCDRGDLESITLQGHDFIDSTTSVSGLASTLMPVLTTQYSRSTLIDAVSCTRLTFDRNLRCSDPARGDAVLDGFVVETKSARAPSAVDQWLWSHHVRPVKLSKFGTGLAATRPELPANKWHRLIARHWHTQPALRSAVTW